MVRTQIQLPDPLYRRLKQTAERLDWSLAELIRRAAESYLQTLPATSSAAEDWELPILPPSGGYVADPAGVSPEAEVIARFRR